MTIPWVWQRDKGILTVDGTDYECLSNVRNELNGRRRLHDPKEVVRMIPTAHPYMPRPFPLGRWSILGVIRRHPGDPRYNVLGPVFIRTDACQVLPVWALDERGGYDHETDELVMDTAYGLHASPDSLTTWGCGRLSSATIARNLGRLVETNDRIILEVV
jgi:hypothetical protein